MTKSPRAPRDYLINAVMALPDDVVPGHPPSHEFQDITDKNARAPKSQLTVADLRISTEVSSDALCFHQRRLHKQLGEL
jgi:hypothetical protein